MIMKVSALSIPDLILLEPRVFSDERGYFFESFNSDVFESATGLSLTFVQDNESMSHKGVLRGLHFQAPPYAQGKLVRVVQGSVYDVAVDIRTNSPHYGRWCGEILSADNKRQLFIPEGFAHGFAVLEDHTIFSYKCTAPYHKASEGCIAWNDPSLNIKWPVHAAVVSEKDKLSAHFFNTFKTPF